MTRGQESLFNGFDSLLASHEASRIWDIDNSTVRKAIASGRLIEGVDCKKFGRQWVVTIDAMAREFGGWEKWSRHKVTQRQQNCLDV